MRWAAALLAGLAAAMAPAAGGGLADELTPVPFVGCDSDGQTGPAPAPRRARPTPRVPTAYAGRLAFYASEYGAGVLAPRGWRCFGLGGSNGSAMIVTPEQHGSELIWGRPVIAGPAVELWTTSSETSGRFEVARVAARFFPIAKDFVKAVAAEGLEDIKPTEVTAADRITARTATRVDFITAASKRGLGTRSRMKPSRDPVWGAYIIDEEGLFAVRVRVPPSQTALAPMIIDEVGRRARPWPKAR